MGDENPICTLEITPNLATKAAKTSLSSPMGTMWCRCDPTPSGWCKTDAHSIDFGPRIQNQHLKDFLKLVDSLDLDVANRERTRLRRTAKLQNDILMFQQHQVQIFYDHVNPATRRTIDQSAGGKLRDRNTEESWALLEDLALYDNESWNNPRDFSKPVTEIYLPHGDPSTSDLHLTEIENQVQCLMEAHLAPKQLVHVNKIASSRMICSGPHDTQYCMENPEQAFVDCASSHTNEAKDARLSKFEADFKQQQGDMTNKIDTILKAINDRITGALPSDTVKNLILNVNPTSLVSSVQPKQTLEDEFKDLHLNLSVLEVLAHALMYNAILDKYIESLELGKNRFAFIQGEMPRRMKDPKLFTLPCRLGDSQPFDTLADLGSCVNLIPLYLFKKLKIRLLEENDHIFRLADGTKSYPVGIIKNAEVHIGRLKLFDDFYIINMEKDPATTLLVGRRFLATANVVIDSRKAKIAVGEGITSSDSNGAQPPYYVKKDFMDCHLPEEWEMARDAELNPFKDVFVFRRMVEFLRALPINLKENMWELEDLIENPINWNSPPKCRDGAWHIRIELIDPDGEKFKKMFQSILTTRKISKKESLGEIIDLDHFHDT
ncbi:MAK10-like protein [Tanacetum coccineum]